MSSGGSGDENASKTATPAGGGGGGWGGFAILGASLKEMGTQIAQQAQLHDQRVQTIGSEHGQQQQPPLDSTKPGEGLLCRLGGGLTKSNHGGEVLPDPTVPSSPAGDIKSSSAVKTPLATRNPDDVSKEELLEILKKMNSRVKALSQSRVQLAEKIKSVEEDKARLLALIRNEILDESVIAEATEKMTKLQQQQGLGEGEEGKETVPDEILVLHTAWRAADERNQLALQHIQNEYKVIAMQTQAEVEKVRATVIAEKDAEIRRMKADMKEALKNVERDGAFMANGDFVEIAVEKAEKNDEQLLQREEEILALKDEIQSLKAVAAAAAAVTTANCSASNEGVELQQKNEEIANLKKENHGLKVKFKEHIDKINAFKQKVAIELRNAKEEVAASANAAEEAKTALEEALKNKLNYESVEILAEKERRIQELENSLLHEVEKVKQELIQKHECEVKEALENEAIMANDKSALDLKEMQLNADLQLEEAIERVRAETTALMEKRISDAVLSAKTEAVNLASAELTSSFEQQYQNAMSAMEQKHSADMEDQRLRLAQEHLVVLEEVKSKSQIAFEKMRSEETARWESELERVRDEVHEEVESLMKEAMQERLSQAKEELVTAHSAEIEELRKTLTKELIAEAERAHATQIVELCNDLAAKHEAQLERVRSDLMVMSESSQSEKIEQLMASHEEEKALIRSEMEALLSQAVEQKTEELSALHSRELEILRHELKSSASEEIHRLSAVADEQREADARRIIIELNEIHAAELKKLQEVIEETRRTSVDQEVVKQITSLHAEELANARSESEVSATQAMEKKLNEMAEIHSSELNKLREELELLSSEKMQRIQAAAEEQRLEDVKRTTVELNILHREELEVIRSEFLNTANNSQSEQLDQLTARHNEELARVRTELESLTVQAVERRTEELSSMHAQELQKLSHKLQSSAAEEMQRLLAAAEEQHIVDIQRITNGLNESHRLELEKTRSDVLNMTNSSHREQLDQLTALHNEELARVRSELQASILQAENNTEQLSASHAAEMNNLREHLLSSSSEEIQRQLAAANMQHVAECRRITDELEASHAADLDKVKSEMLVMANCSHSEQLQQLTASHKEEILRVRDEFESSLSQEVEQNTRELSLLHSHQLENLRNRLLSSSSEEIKRIQAKAEEDRLTSIGLVTNELNNSYEEEMKRLVRTHEEAMNRMRDEMEASACKACEEKTLLLSQTHATHIDNLMAESERQCEARVQRITEELNEKYFLQIEKVKSDMFAMANSSQSEQLEQLVTAHREELERVQAEAQQQHEKEMERQRSSLIAAAQTKHTEKMEEKLKEINAVHESEIKSLNDEIANLLALQTSLQGENEKMRAIVASERSSLEEALQTSKNGSAAIVRALEDKIAEMTASHEEQLHLIQKDIDSKRRVSEENLLKDIEEKNKELEKVQEELKVAEKKSAQAIQLANKIKKAAVDKMATINEEHSKTLAEAEKANEKALSSLMSETESLRKRLERSMKDKEVLESSLVHAKTMHEEELKTAVSIGLDDKMKQLSEEHAATILQLTKDHEEKIAKVEEEHRSLVERIQAECKSKLDEHAQENATNKAKLQKMMAKHADDLKTHYEGRLKTMKEEDESRLRGLTEELAKLKKTNESLTKEVETHRSDGESLRNALRDSNTRENTLLHQVEALKKEIEDLSNSVNKTANQMLEQQSKLEQQLKQVSAEKNAISNKNEELSGKLNALSSNLTMLAEDKKDTEEALERSSKMLSRYKNAETELNGLRQENNALKLEQTKTKSALAKLKQEQDTNQLKHGQRTALVGMLEEQVADLNDSLSEAKAKLEAASYDLSQKGEEIESLRQELETAKGALKEAESNAAESVAAARQNTDNDSVQKASMIKTLKAQIDSLQNQMKKKSAAAQKMIKEREAECAELRKINSSLQKEVDRGSLSDRRIFELAAHQSNRDTAAVAEIAIRDTMIEQLSRKLEEGDGDLASAEITVVRAEDQVEQLARVHRREGVNMDYLKSIVVQYLAKPPGSSERTALLPVLATLLQFDPNDYKAIEEGKDKVTWWGEIIPTYISSPLEAPSSRMPSSIPAHQVVPLLSTSAEVTVSRITPSEHRKNTSLQF
ncbi:hypothetical protein ACHAXA_011067 [Cyclostephanos tholiformis]|uniref:GRIP domain-containing protein n=1 Tax=Cyclostephanos tholiformis TaxID=382380 RepID=A0ABD3RVS2_9STRA